MSKTLKITILVFSTIFSSCTGNKIPTPSYPDYSGTQICAYDAKSNFLGIVNNKTDQGIEFITKAGYHIFLDPKNKIVVNYDFTKFKLLTNQTDISNNSILGVVTEDTNVNSEYIAISFTIEGDNKPIFLCFEHNNPIQVNTGDNFMELVRVTEDPSYKGLYEYKISDKTILSGSYYIASLCNKDNLGISIDYFQHPLSIRTATGGVFNGSVINGKIV